ncbi:MAG: DUF4824 family protein [Candidatus Electrothrix aestuarii]|uniref:DUF4824 family protein n=1 Tax=Candidatus Electrothrix aestuarii TaxID=3062594 RepID=A0AAU8LPT2_9BACT|nr:DUF4824 family protein [Candidatus Electrothrix aestuarii]
MNRRFLSRALFALGFILVIGVNIAVLSGVAVNRSGTPEAEIFLTERELPLSWQWVKENSGVALQLTWRIISQDKESTHYNRWGTPAWFNADKLEELGFKIDSYLRSEEQKFGSRRFVAKQVFLVLENDGELYQEAVRRAELFLEKKQEAVRLNSGDEKLRDELERAEQQLQRERMSASRLFVLDAGLDSKELREKYQDKTRYIITKGVVQPGYMYTKEREEIFGLIKEISKERIHVPLEFRKTLETALARNKVTSSDERPPRYQVKLAYGRRLEPWIVSVQKLSESSQGGLHE